MAKTVIVQSGQTLVDICMQELGDATRLFELARLNGLLPGVALVVGSTVLVPEYESKKSAVIAKFLKNAPASDFETDPETISGNWQSGAVEAISESSGYVQVQAGQTLVDICIQELGDATRLFELAQLNKLQVGEALQAGTWIQLLAVKDGFERFLKGFSINKPASIASADQVIVNEGIGYWAIGIDNIVN